MGNEGAHILPNPENSLDYINEEEPVLFTYVTVNNEVTRTCVYNEFRRLMLEIKGE